MSGERVESGSDGLAWFKSSHSAGDGGQCVEVAATPDRVHIRDSKDATRAALAVDPTTWTEFVAFAAL
ncbi:MULTISPECIES: DUF397 domain-containing protein [Streptomyces]|uniref:DUF397 domain-containing protein n=1 Tax=Streptomyces flaveolus TaxID=67297 RepID=A0ABV3AGG8_9ACTN|nr:MULTISPECIES: DUF397 domain-containing protein [Streptomyces]KMS82553.1 toxin-antitoxin system, toxin component [Streptomyces regensis]